MARSDRGRCRAEPRKSARTSITRSKADRDSSSCDARTNHSHGVTPRFIAPRSDAGPGPSRENYARRRRRRFTPAGGASVARSASCEIGIRDFFFIRSRYLESRIRKLLSSSEMGETDVGGGDSDLAWRQMGKMAARLKTRECS